MKPFTHLHLYSLLRLPGNAAAVCRICVQFAAVCRGAGGHGNDTWLTWTIGLLREVIV